MSIPEHVKSHPIFGGGRYGIMSGENPMFNSGVEQPSHEKLIRALKDMHLKFEETHGRYGVPERGVIIHNPSREHMSQLGKMFGQESVIFGQGGRHELLYTNGEHEGKSRLTDPTQHPINYFPDPPEDYYSALPGHGGYFRINFDFGSEPTYQGPVEASKLNKGWPKDEAENQANMQAHQVVQDMIMERSKPVYDPDGKAGMGWLPEIEDSLAENIRRKGYKRIQEVVNDSYRNASNFGNIREPAVRGGTYNRVDPSDPQKGQVQPVFSLLSGPYENIARENDRSFWKEVDKYSTPINEPRRVADAKIDMSPITRSNDHIYDYSHLLSEQHKGQGHRLLVMQDPDGLNSLIGVHVDSDGKHLEPHGIGSLDEPYSSQGWRGPELSPELKQALVLHSAWDQNRQREQRIADNAIAARDEGKPFYIPGPNSSAAQIPSQQEMTEALKRSPIMKRKKKLGKAALDSGKTGRHNVLLPVGSQIDSGPAGTRNVGKIKVQDKETGKTKWRSVRAGLVMDPQGNPVSSRNPSGNLGKSLADIRKAALNWNKPKDVEVAHTGDGVYMTSTVDGKTKLEHHQGGNSETLANTKDVSDAKERAEEHMAKAWPKEAEDGQSHLKIAKHPHAYDWHDFE